MVKRIEAAGSKSGRTAQRVVIVDCGELASRRKIMAQLEAEKARACACQLPGTAASRMPMEQLALIWTLITDVTWHAVARATTQA